MKMIKHFLPRTLLGRSILIVVVPLIMLQVVTTFIFFNRHWETISLLLSRSFSGNISMVIDTMNRFSEVEDREWIFMVSPGNLGLELSFEEGAILSEETAKKSDGLIEEMLEQGMDERVRRPFRIDNENFGDKVQVKIQLPEGVLNVLGKRKLLFSSTTYILILWMIGTSLILLAVAIIFMRNQVRPIRRLAAAADNFGKGRDVPYFKPEGAAEVRRAAAAFKLMQARIQRQISQRTEMLAGVSHDLGTVLTRMKLELAMLGDSSEAKALATDVAEMEHMIEGYLAFARGEGKENAEPVKVDRMLAEVADNARRNGAEIELEADTGMTITLRHNAFRRCFGNLLGNAARHAQHIRLAAQRRDHQLEITVDDDGPGIPEDRREDVFKAFFRLDEARNLDSGGVGLGLSISRDIVHAHGGEISLETSPLGGLRVVVLLPV
ncbi:MAG: ATP-binding protein [Alphaproteobacteria bacterium]|nr:ATP-binding protein [Alphaproteobacteria bacterium]